MSRADIAPARVRPRRWSVAVGGALLSIALATGGCSVAEEPGQTGGTEAGNTYLEGVLASPSQTSADPLAADIQFAGLLLRNHRDAIQQSDQVLVKDGVDREIRATAERMKSEHEERAGRLESMLEGWGVPSDDVRGAGAESTPSAQPESTEDAEPAQIVGDELRAGLLSDREKNVLAAAEPEEAGRIYLLQMHRLYQGALTISATEAEDGSDDAAKELASSVVEGHRKELESLAETLAEMGVIGSSGARTADPSGFTGPIKIEGTGANGGSVPSDFVPEPVQRVHSFRATQKPVLPSSSSPSSSSASESASATGSASASGRDAEDQRGRDAASASPSPSPADTAQATPRPSSGASPSPSASR
ncbi:DUF305 domain-containing protein [Micrococcus luteus]|uniref:DUF305 domain-containing protein n=1 Tax=Micrococcus luteus TaxID=1270 RepID=UPI0028920E49|nr:DUF305 domain-containing protein [Micrococcus luteus]MDT1990892.1 DUF305 domain-containing protein [Micrococcus luteus]